ncbi:hypothetical protein [Pseudoalteromonas luteoviolacea]|uniref:hypothetical protein n=1 Tax=Pseudoalteromonas luteoviolacea TaxID=43657 RepID=UPI00115469A8|nr:hypothetical protein [Pseudoalteromonas luteoviolacea]TQF67825.1 hypothetical protein FLM44_21845 [Pseudoalteromonas luteoviolacea]
MSSYSIDDRDKAISSIKDVLYMYTTLVKYNGFFDDFSFENGKFDPFHYIDCHADKLGISEEEALLLNEGSAVKIICEVLFYWGQGNHPEENIEYIDAAKKLIKSGRVDHLNKLRSALITSIESDEEFWKISNDLYQEVVVGYFQSLIGENTKRN